MGDDSAVGPIGDAASRPVISTASTISASSVGEAEAWQGVATRYLWVDLVARAVPWLVVIAVLGFIATGARVGWLWFVAGAAAVVMILLLAFTPARVRSIRYRLRDDDLVFRRGIMWRRVVAVPYGRMQLIDITRGPIARALGLAELKFVTAAAATAIVIPGLPEADAEALRDRLVVLAESRRAGL